MTLHSTSLRPLAPLVGLLLSTSIAMGDADFKGCTPPWDATAKKIGRELPAMNGVDGKPITGFIFRATSKPRAIFVCLHGIQTHASWYAPLAAELRSQGITLYCPNRRGSGVESADAARAGQGGWNDWVKDTQTVIRAARSEGAPVYLLGTSWGAKLALATVADGAEKVDGTLLLAPALKTTKEGLWQVIKVGVCGFFAPQRPITVPLEDADYLPISASRSPSDEQLLSQMGCDHALKRKATPHFLKQARAMQKSALESLEQSQGGKHITSVFAGKDRIVKREASLDELEDTGAPPPLPDLADAGHGVQVQEAASLAKRVVGYVNAQHQH